MRNLPIALLFVLAALCCNVASADVSVDIGPTSIARGDAQGARDITVNNGVFVVAFAVDTAAPWGHARGGIVDIAVIKDGEISFDIASLADFMPNKWSSWPTTYQDVSIETQTAAEVVIKSVRDWGEVELVSTFHIKEGDSRIHVVTTMSNAGDNSLGGLYTGYVLWPDGGSLIGSPGMSVHLYNVKEDALTRWSASYDENWALGLHVSAAEYSSYGGRDRYLQHDLQPGQTRSFEAWLQIEDSGSLAPLVQTEIDLLQLQFGRISGRVMSTDGEPVSKPAVVVNKNGKPYAWTIGNDGAYEFDLPVGEYDIYATARGYSQGAPKNLIVAKDSDTQIDFDDTKPPGTIHIQVADDSSGMPLDARISIESGLKPVIGFFGKDVLFTELDPVGELRESFPPGNYVLKVSAGGGFTSTPQLLEVEIEPGQTNAVEVDINIAAQPSKHGWYGADLHHHSDVLDGFTEAEFVMRSELASGVDLTFLSDHDSVVNNAEMHSLSHKRGLLFIAGTEMSPSWAHFNAFPLDDGKTIDIVTSEASASEIFAAARRMGADVVEINHPYSNYGYFETDENGSIPGGFDENYDLVEIEPWISDGYQERNDKTLQRVWRSWTDGHRAYLAAGSDVHDVWRQESGSARTFVHVDGKLTIVNFIANLKAGHSYVSQGPLVYPEILFGSDIDHAAGDSLALNYSIHAVMGLKSVILIEHGKEIDARAFDGVDTVVAVEFSVSPESNSWYSLVIEDNDGKFAYTNPVWVTVTE